MSKSKKYPAKDSRKHNSRISSSHKNGRKDGHKDGQQNRQQKSSSQINRGPQNGLWLCGKHPVFSILATKRRQIFEVLVTKNSLSELESFFKKNALSELNHLVKLVDSDTIIEACGPSHIHQGIAVNCSPLPTKNQNELLHELNAIEDKKDLPKLLLLDQISDPQNIGAIIRSAISFGVTKIIFCEHNSPKENATIVKAAAGTIEFCDLIVVTNFNNLIEKIKKIGYWCVGLAGEGTFTLKEAQTYDNIALIVGSEGDGIRSLVKKNCDLLVKIAIDEKVESLNASVATAIALYELSKS